MNKNVLINVFSPMVKNDLISIMVESKQFFLEVGNTEELIFKYNLIKDDLELYVHELNEKEYDSSMNQIRKIDTEKVRTIVLIHEYSSKVIDDCLALQVKDIVVLPLKKENLKKKIISATLPMRASTPMPNKPEEVKEVELISLDRERLREEVNRAIRGDYPLSLVNIHYDYDSRDAYNQFIKELKKLLRTTDIILGYSDKQLLLLCPFTPKSYIVEVENKARVSHAQVKRTIGVVSDIHVYGVTFPDDDEQIDKLLQMMEDGIHDSMLFSNIEGTLQDLDRDQIKKMMKRDY